MTWPPLRTTRRLKNLSYGFLGFLAASVFARTAEVKNFAILASTAEKSLRQFSTQSGVDVVYPTDVVRGVRTPEVKGTMTPAEAVARLLAGTKLASARDERSGAFSISRKVDPNGQRAAFTKENDRPPLNLLPSFLKPTPQP